ncbi:MAG: TIGR01777 family oxidoreductase [Acidimicrobiales bacterium]
MNVLVTGSSGLIGTALVARLRASGPVIRLVRREPAPGPVTDVRWDPASGSVDLAALERAGPFDGAVHLAGAGIGDRRWSPSRKQVVLQSRTMSTRLLVDTLLRLPAPPAVLVSGSAVGWYGVRGDEELTEASAAGTGFLADVCRAWEAETRPATDAGIRTVLLRSGIVLSASGGVLGRQLPLFRLGLGGRTGSGRQYRSWITLEDEVGVIEYCLRDDRVAGPVNATAPHPATDGELAREVGAALRRPAVLPVPGAALRLLLGTEMAEQLVLGGQRVLPEALRSLGYEFARPDLHGAVRSVLAPPG